MTAVETTPRRRPSRRASSVRACRARRTAGSSRARASSSTTSSGTTWAIVHFVRSPYAHAKIGSIDVSAALELPGVYGTLTGDEVALLTDPFFQIAAPPGGHVKDYALAVGKVRYVGEPVVAVVAETRELARDAAELVVVEYEPLDVVVDARKALDDGAPLLHEEVGGEHVVHRRLGVG